jgi:hypothetical protein
MDRGSVVILPHEIHSGIVPKFEWVTDGHRWGIKAAKEARVEDAFFRSGKEGYIQRLANFQFYLHRWSSRQMTIGAVFSPQLVLGLPAVIFDRPTYPPTVLKTFESQLGRKWMPMQYIGKIVSLSHSLNQGGGQTQAAFAYCRTHRGQDDEFIGLLSREVEGTRKSELERKFNPRELVDSNRRFVRRNRRALVRVIRRYLRDQATEGMDFGRNLRVQKTKTDETSTVTLSVLESQNLGLGDLAGENGLELPRLFTLTLERELRAGESQVVTSAIEDVLRPGWYSDVWSNDNIGADVYRPLLGIGSIVDDIILSQADQAELLNRSVQEVEVSTTDQSGEPTTTDFVVGDDDFPGEIATREIVPGSIEEAIDAIGVLYSIIRHRGGDVHDFIRQFTGRPVADMEDVLGSQGLLFDDNGNVAASLPNDVVEGFHSRAFGDYNTDVKLPDTEGVETQAGQGALHTLFPGVPKGTSVPRASIVTRGGVKAAVRPELDPRGRARSRVRAYIEELEVSRGLLG